NPIISGLDSIGIASGKSRVTVWSVMKLLFTLTLFVLAAAWISRWIDRRLKRMWSLRPGIWFRPAVDRLQLRLRFRAADGSIDQARRCHQLVRAERHEHGEFR